MPDDDGSLRTKVHAHSQSGTREDHDPISTKVIDPLDVGSVLGNRYRLDTHLGEGGMGTVWSAADLTLGERPVAIKVMNPSVTSKDANERFRREATTIAKLGQSEHVVTIYDYGIDPDTQRPYIVMEKLKGEDLRRRLERGRLGYRQTLEIIAQVCAAMGRAHELGVVHRDLKPANIYLLTDGDEPRCKVLDFGLAKLMEPSPGAVPSVTQSGRMPGTLRYMSPEQFDDPRHVDRRSDLWAIGVLAYECLTGQHPFPRANDYVTRLKARNKPSDPRRHPELPPGFIEWFDRATAVDVDDRFQSTDEMLDALRALEDTAPPVPDTTTSRKAWASDANQIDITALREVTFLNRVVEEFLHDENQRFVCGAKGVGKTLLLSYKRALLSERHQTDVRFVPEGRPYLDFMVDLPTMSKKHIDLMSKLTNCKRLWALCLRASLLSHSTSLLTDLDGLPDEFLALLRSGGVAPTIVLKALLGHSVRDINQIVDANENLLDHKVRSLHSGVYVFVDKLDQALRGVSREAWVSMQAGLMEAAWDLMSTNPHVKVFATIREEAFSTYQSDIRSNLYGAITHIRYEPEDLRGIFKTLTRFYEGLSVEQFLNVNVGSASERSEEPFGFFSRHTLGRPRDLVILASALSQRRTSSSEDSFKRIVRETSANFLMQNVFEELGVFLELLREKRAREAFLTMLPASVLSRDELLAVSAQFLGQVYDPREPPSGEAVQCWRELYDCGLLGVVDLDDEHGPVQRFRQPHEDIDIDRQRLPRSPWYLLHPALQAWIAPLAEGFRKLRGVTIGHSECWHREYDIVLRVHQALRAAPRPPNPEVEELLDDVLLGFLTLVGNGVDLTDAKARTASTKDFASLSRRLDRLGWDELHLCLLEIFPAAASP